MACFTSNTLLKSRGQYARLRAIRHRSAFQVDTTGYKCSLVPKKQSQMAPPAHPCLLKANCSAGVQRQPTSQHVGEHAAGPTPQDARNLHHTAHPCSMHCQPLATAATQTYHCAAACRKRAAAVAAVLLIRPALLPQLRAASNSQPGRHTRQRPQTPPAHQRCLQSRQCKCLLLHHQAARPHACFPLPPPTPKHGPDCRHNCTGRRNCTLRAAPASAAAPYNLKTAGSCARCTAAGPAPLPKPPSQASLPAAAVRCSRCTPRAALLLLMCK